MREIFNRTGDPAVLLFPPTTREARMLEALGYDTFYVGAGAVIGPILGRPDDGTITLTESVQVSKWFVDAVNIPVWTDTDACFGGIFQVRRAVEEFIKADVAAITIEDQPYIGKRFGGMVGKEVIPRDEAVAKFRVAADTRDAAGSEFQIVARCDALHASNSGGLPEVIERLKAYQDAGADVLYFEGPESLEQIETVREAVSGPLTCTPFNLPQEITKERGAELGLCAVFYLEASRAVKNWFWYLLESIAREGYGGIKGVLDAIPDPDRAAPRNVEVMAQLRRFEEAYLPQRLLDKYGDATSTTVSETAGTVEH